MKKNQEMKILIYCTTIVLLSACAGSSEDKNLTAQQNSKEEFVDMPPHKEQWTLIDSSCNAPGVCARVSVTFEYPDYVKKQTHLALQEYFHDQTREALQSLVNDSAIGELKQLGESFLHQYAEELENARAEGFSDPNWYADFKGYVLDSNEEWITVNWLHNSYTGGAHGNYEQHLQTFSRVNQQPLKLNDIQLNEQVVINAFENAFRERFQLEPGFVYANSAFWFAGDTFHLGKNMALRNDSLVVLYNPYEIAAYSVGIIELALPLDSLKKQAEI